jgi:hypothetical protein
MSYNTAFNTLTINEDAGPTWLSADCSQTSLGPLSAHSHPSRRCSAALIAAHVSP